MVVAMGYVWGGVGVWVGGEGGGGMCICGRAAHMLGPRVSWGVGREGEGAGAHAADLIWVV